MLICISLKYPKSSQFGFGCISWNHSKSSKSQLFVFGPVSYPHQLGHIRFLACKALQSPEAPGDSAGGMLGLLYVCIAIHIHFNYCITLLHEIMIIYDHIIYFYTSVTYGICSDDDVILEHFVIFGRIHFFPGFWTQKWWIWGPWMDRSVHGSWQAFFSKPTVVLQGCTKKT